MSNECKINYSKEDLEKLVELWKKAYPSLQFDVSNYKIRCEEEYDLPIVELIAKTYNRNLIKFITVHFGQGGNEMAIGIVTPKPKKGLDKFFINEMKKYTEYSEKLLENHRIRKENKEALDALRIHQ